MKKFFKENRIFVIMMGIVLVCLVIILSLLFVYFYKGNSKDKYGSRLNDIKDVQITNNEKSSTINKIKEDESVKSVTIDVFGKIVYINLDFNEGVVLDVAKSKALEYLDNFDEEELNLYDFQISLKESSSSGYLVSGAKNNGSSMITWNNNRSSEE